MPKVQHISTNSYESIMVDALFKSFTGRSGDIEYSHVIAKKEDLVTVIDDSCTVLVLTGFSISHLEDGALLNKLYYEYNVPFAEVIIIGAMTAHSDMPSFHKFLGSDTESAVKQFYNFVCEGHSSFIDELGTRGMSKLVDSYDSYNLYNFSERGDIAPLQQVLLASSFGFGLGNVLHSNGYHNYLNNPELEALVTQSLRSMSHYLDSHIRWTEWAVMQDRSGEYITVGVVSAERHKNELAHRMLSMSNTPKAIAIILEDKGYTQMTIRTSNYDAVRVGSLIDPNTRGKYNACTVFTNLPRVAKSTISALEAQIKLN